MIAGYLDASKACVLIALDQLFHGDYEGKEFLEQYYHEHASHRGFEEAEDILILESAPVTIYRPKGAFTTVYSQDALYSEIIDREQQIRYRIPQQDEFIMCYVVSDLNLLGHAICIRGSIINIIATKYVPYMFIFKSRGLIIDKGII